MALCSFLLLSLLYTAVVQADARRDLILEKQIEKMEAQVLTDRTPAELANLVTRKVELDLRVANQASTLEWRNIHTKDQWETFRNQRIAALQASLGQFPAVPETLHPRVVKTLSGEGFHIENLIFESRPGLFVTANLYLPDPARESMPGFVLCHSHHNPKTQDELQDMGMTWARLGCMVLIMDQLGHGERRQHPFRSANDYAREFRVSREDYHFRYNIGLQLHLIGDSLMGWMVWDLRRGVDLLLTRTGVDPHRIILIGSVAGGGDPAAVAAALDNRISAAVPFNFGGPQPESPYPLPPDAEEVFDYSGSGSWESTRNLRSSCQAGFLPWVIVGAIAPRCLIYAHEFSWDREYDPVWKRLNVIFKDYYHSSDNLDYTTGFGELRGKPPAASHCNNVGPPHRKRIYSALNHWFQIPGGAELEYSKRLPVEDLVCFDANVAQELQPRPLHLLLNEIADARMARFRSTVTSLTPGQRRQLLQQAWQNLLGDPYHSRQPRVLRQTKETFNGGLRIERIALEVEGDVVVPLLLLKVNHRSERSPVIVGIAQGGKREFLRQRSSMISRLLNGGAIVCLPDLRGTGETRAGAARDREGTDTSISTTHWMLGRTMVGERLADLRSVLCYLRTRPEINAREMAVWGDSFADVNLPGAELKVPLGVITGRPPLAEPLGGVLALLAGLFEEDVKAIQIRSGLLSFKSLLSSQFLYTPHDIVVPGALMAGDLCDVAATLAPRPLFMHQLVDGLNQQATTSKVRAEYEMTIRAYQEQSAEKKLEFLSSGEFTADGDWLLKALKE